MPKNRLTCTRKLEFDAAHRVMLHESKCKYLHGHRYVVEATFEADHGLDALGRVVDFGQVKQVLGGWIDSHWDHTAILNWEDKKMGDFLEAECGQKVYYLEGNPTAENLAKYLFEKICPKLFGGKGLNCVHVRVYETPNCYAECS